MGPTFKVGIANEYAWVPKQYAEKLLFKPTPIPPPPPKNELSLVVGGQLVTVLWTKDGWIEQEDPAAKWDRDNPNTPRSK